MTRRVVQSVGVLVVAGLLVTHMSNSASAQRSRATLRQVGVPAFVFPANGAAYPATAPYIFKVKPVSHAIGYLWSFIQNNVIVYQNLAWEGHLSPSSYTVSLGSKAHQLIHVGDLRVGVRAMLVGGHWSTTGEVSVRIQQGHVARSHAPRRAHERTSTLGPVARCQFRIADQPLKVAFCETFDQAAGTGNRSGALNGTLWGVSRLSGATSLGGPFDGWEPTTMQKCGQNVTVQAENDVAICNGQLVEAQHDGGTVTSLALYPKQPFDIAGRTGTAVFDVSDDTQGSHAAWPEFWYTDQPVPAPFVHEASFQATPRNGFGIRFAAVCPAGQGPNCGPGPGCQNNSTSVVTVDSADVVRNYESFDTFQGTNGAMTVTALDCVKASTGPGDLNHFEVRVSQNEVDVYGTDAGTTAPLKEIATITNANLTLTRGLIWLEDVHYNGNKLNTQGTHTFTWDNVGFDGPVLPRDLAFDVTDSLTPGISLPNGDAGFNLGWPVPSDGTQLSLTPLPMTAANLTAAAGALLTFNYYSQDEVTLSYQLNNNAWHSLPWPFPDNTTYSWRALAVPLSLAELQAGTNTLHFKASGGTNLANVDVVLQGAGGIVAPTR